MKTYTILVISLLTLSPENLSAQDSLTIGRTSVHIGDAKAETLSRLRSDGVWFYGGKAPSGEEGLEYFSVYSDSIPYDTKNLGYIYFKNNRASSIQRKIGNYEDRGGWEFAKALSSVLANKTSGKGAMAIVKFETFKAALDQGMRIDDDELSLAFGNTHSVWFTVGESVVSDGSVSKRLVLMEGVFK